MSPLPEKAGFKSDLKTAFLAGAITIFLVALGNLYFQVGRLRAQMASSQETIVTELNKLRSAYAAASASRPRPAVSESNRKEIESLKTRMQAELESMRGVASAAAADARTEADTHAEKLVRQLGEKYQDQHLEVAGALGQIKQAEATTSATIDGFGADIAGIKTDVATTRFELEKTAGELKRVIGDLGIQSGYIAANAKELNTLRLLGDRNYIDFHIQRDGQPRRVGRITLILKKTDPKHNKYTIEVTANDKKSEKKDKVVNEPVQFYTTKSRVPDEIVINEVQKDYAIGYLSIPRN